MATGSRGGDVRVSARRARVADGVYALYAVARRGRKVVGGASGQVGELRALLDWKMRSGVGGWAGDEWNAFRPGERVGYFQGLDVDPEERGHGVGRALAAALVAAMDALRPDAIWLVVSPMDNETDSSGLVRLYRSLGFDVVDESGRDEDYNPMMVRRTRR